jgi:hypothetical protein
MGLIITLIVFVGLAAIIVWIADWTSGVQRRSDRLVKRGREKLGD